MTLGQRIQELRKQAGLSQEALGEALGVSRQAVSKWEGDNGIPELDTIIAMSKLFGVTLGQLLGVEEPEEKPNEDIPHTSAGFTEEQVEEVLRRYVEESKKQEEAPENTVGSYPLGSWIIAALAVIIAVVVAVMAIRQVRDFKRNFDNLRTDLTNMEQIVTNVRNQVGGLSDELRGVLEEQSSLLSTFDYEVVGFNVEQQTVDFKLSATLKSFTEGNRMQFLLKWKKVDQTEGELVSDSVEGPNFVTTLTIPMNYHLEIGLRVLQTDGTILEQPVETLYSGMNPEEFKVVSYGRGSWTMPEDGRFGYQVDMRSEWPEQIYPVGAVMVIILNGEEVYREAVAITPPEETPISSPQGGGYQVIGEVRLEPYKDTDDLQALCYVTDNFGRVEEFQMPINMAEEEVHSW